MRRDKVMEQSEKDELINAVISILKTKIMRNVITEDELEEVVLVLTEPMQRSLDEAKRRMLGE